MITNEIVFKAQLLFWKIIQIPTFRVCALKSSLKSGFSKSIKCDSETEQWTERRVVEAVSRVAVLLTGSMDNALSPLSPY